MNTINWQQQADRYLMDEEYARAANLYEKAISAEPQNKSHYWNLGLMLLLQGQEMEAQTTWLIGMAEEEDEIVEQWTSELIQVLETEANRRATIEDYSIAWAIRQHIRELNPTEINNLLHLVDLSIELENYTGNELTDLGVISLLTAEVVLESNYDLLVHVWQKVLNYAPLHPSSIKFTEICVNKITEPTDIARMLLPVVYEIAYSKKEQPTAISLCELGLRQNQHPELMIAIASFYADIGEYSKAIEWVEQSYSLAEELPDKVFYNHIILRSMMNAGGYWEKLPNLIDRQELLLKSLSEHDLTKIGASVNLVRLYNTAFFFPYFRDCLESNVKLRIQVAKVCQKNLEALYEKNIKLYRQGRDRKAIPSKKPLKIGYLCHCLRRHSVGWIARWLFQHHNRDRFQIYAYLLASKNENDPLQQWYVQQATQAYRYGLAGPEVAEQIYQDEIDILIDLDSITLSSSCGIVASKPAPIQATWLGWDASGIPTIDYFIADPYVLPENAGDYYLEKIWRLPQTYVAVDGFEIGVPSLRRNDLNIPSDAVVYFSAQRGPKYNPQTVRLQMKILKEVPNSYFVIKGFGDSEALNTFMLKIAEEEGLDSKYLRFIPRVAFEEIHRANLGIADIILDTYPYNGATTTLETLWFGIPIVTKVGEQFCSRNSYTMMMNAGITEGIAWSDEEYVEWGIRLGKDEALRQQISWKLRKSRQTAPLWNAKQFTREMEKAYEQMWQIYTDGK